MSRENQNLLCSYIGPEGEVVHCNDDFLRLLGQGATLKGKSIRKLFPSIEAEKLLAAIDSCRNRPGQTVSIEITTVVQGREHYFLWSVFTGENGGVQLIGRDITQERQLQRDLLFQDSLLQNIQDAVISTDPLFRIKAYNQAAVEIYGLPSEGVIGKPISEFISYHYPFTSRDEAADQLFRTGRWRGIVHFRKGSENIVLEGSVSAVKNHLGETTGYVAVNRVHQEDAYEEALHQFEALFGYLDDGVFLLDSHTRLHFCNEKAREIGAKAYGSGFSEGESILSALPAHRRQFVQDGIGKVLHGETIRYEVEVPLCGQPSLWLDCCYFPVRNRKGQLHFIGAIVKDITQRKAVTELERERREAQDHLYHARYQFEQFMENSPLVAWITDDAGIMTYMNPLYRKTYGFSAEDVDKPIDQLFPPAMAREYRQNNRTVIRGGKPVITIEPAVLPNGQRQVLKIFKFPLYLNGRKLVAGWAVDITDQNQLQDELARSLEHYDYIGEATSDAIYEWNVASGCVRWGRGFNRMFGYTEEISEHFIHVHPDERQSVIDRMVGLLNDDSVDRWELEYRGITATGEVKHILSRAFVLREEGSPMRVIGALQDVTRQKDLQARLVAQERKSRRQVVRSIIETQEKERRNLSVELHDNVNQMLASCKLMLEVARENGPNAPLLTEKSYQGLQEVINEIRKISHELNPSIVEDVGLIDAIHQMVDTINLTGRMVVSFRHEGVRPLREEDRIAIYRIIQEQLSNIIKYAEARQVLIELDMSGGQTLLRITDDGVGFDTQTAKKGLGLKNIYHRVDYYAGTMNIFSEKDQGCVLEIRLQL